MARILDELCYMLDSYGGRDKVMKMLCYSAKLMSGLTANKDPETSKKLAIFSSKISSARSTLRLVDDFPALQYSIEYGFGKQEPDKTLSVLGVIANVVDQIYYPIDKMCWFIEHKLIHVKNEDMWDLINSIFWVISIYLNLVRTIRKLTIMQEHKSCLKLDQRDALKKLLSKQEMEILSLIRFSLDFAHAVSTLPKGYLWGGKLKVWHVGLIGSLSASIGIYQLIKKRKAA